VDVTAAIADHGHGLDLSSLGSDRWNPEHIQVKHTAAGAVGINVIGAAFLSLRAKIGLVEYPKTITGVIALGEFALAVKDRNPGDDLRRTVRKSCRRIGGDAKRVFALERRVRATKIV